MESQLKPAPKPAIELPAKHKGGSSAFLKNQTSKFLF